LPDGGSLNADGSSAGVLRFSNKPEAVFNCYVAPDEKLSRWSGSLPPDCPFPFLFCPALKQPTPIDLWHLRLPAFA
jgi:hypothetical protein